MAAGACRIVGDDRQGDRREKTCAIKEWADEKYRLESAYPECTVLDFIESVYIQET